MDNDEKTGLLDVLDEASTQEQEQEQGTAALLAISETEQAAREAEFILRDQRRVEYTSSSQAHAALRIPYEHQVHVHSSDPDGNCIIHSVHNAHGLPPLSEEAVQDKRNLIAFHIEANLGRYLPVIL